MRRTVLVAPGLVLALVCGSPALSPAAGWVDDWIAQKTEVSPGYYEGQKRGYFNGGGFSARWVVKNDPVLTFTPPRLKTGCGGIDAFMGGFAFLDTEYLVQKLQNIMSAAPAAAFDIALKTLAPQVSDTIRSLESMADKLNSIQLDECKASRALSATLVKTVAPEQKQGELGAIQADWWQSTGAGDLWTSFQEGREADQGKPDAAATTGSMSGCDATFRAVFTQGSLLANAATQLGLTNTAYIDLVRGFAGDIIIQAPGGGSNAYMVATVGPCDNNKGLEQIVNGSAEAKSAAGACAAMPDTNKDLRQYVYGQLNGIAGAYQTKGVLTTAQRTFIDTMPVSVGLALKTAVAEGVVSQVETQLADVAAKAYAYSILTELYRKTQGVGQLALEVAARNGTAAATTDNPAKCSISNVQEAIAGVEAMMARLDTLTDRARSEYGVAIGEINNINAFLQRLQDFDTLAHRQLRQRFGEGVADRVAGTL